MDDFDWFEFLYLLGFHEACPFPNLFVSHDYDFSIEAKELEGKSQIDVVRLLLDKQKEALLQGASFETGGADVLPESK
ncbi:MULTISPECIES: hypothetical protein [Vibrio]|uniref:hypothetical protein n=1 Tax=Vibrio TaxID=662 RepID=UPI000E0BA1A4|nr:MULTISPECIES: hypothetical protein [Vibrio]MEA5377316.1 hypothetical protein [Vibrio parahaemolyticus]HDY8182557.1 hypothetical protein [Vibrio vulnificus]HDZ9162576.1 hypothetical protein [Vibrio cholerae]